MAARLIDRLYEFMESRQLSAYAVERSCGIANGYLKKQKKGKGTIGSEILERVHQHYPELNLLWLLTGEGEMHAEAILPSAGEEEQQYRLAREEMITLLQEQVRLLQQHLADKEKIIALLEKRLSVPDAAP